MGSKLENATNHNIMRKCSYCKEKAPPGANFCSMCGARLPYIPIPQDEPEKVEAPTVEAKEKKTMVELPPALTAKEVSKYFRISVSTISKLVKEDKIPHVRVGERRLLFPTEKVMEWFNGLADNRGKR